MSACEALAANLTSNYLSNATFDDGFPTLVDFLMTTGVLLSICLGINCTSSSDFDGMGNGNHLSGSWIQASTTGPRMFGGIGVPDDNSQGMVMGAVGMILDPREVQVQCLYPLDAVTDGRSQNGCGSMMDGGWQMPWWVRQQMKLQYYWRKLRHFPTTKWEDIPCSKMLGGDDDDGPGPDFGLNTVVGIKDHQEHWVTNMGFVKRMVESVMGHVVCYDDSTPEFPDESMWMVAYVGDEAWDPADWDNNTAVTQDMIQKFPKDLTGIWNEVVMKNITSQQEYARAIQAIFYVDSICDQGDYFRKQAFAQAKALGDKPVLEFNPRVQEDQVLFRCASEAADETTDETAESAMGCPNVGDLWRQRQHKIMDSISGKKAAQAGTTQAQASPASQLRMIERGEEELRAHGD